MVFSRRLHGLSQTMGRNSALQFRIEMINEHGDDDTSVVSDAEDSVALGDLVMEENPAHHAASGVPSLLGMTFAHSEEDCFDLGNSEEWDDLLLTEAYNYQPTCNLDDSLHGISELEPLQKPKPSDAARILTRQPSLREMLKQSSSRRLLMESARQSSSRRLLFASVSQQRQGSSRRFMMELSSRWPSSQSLLSNLPLVPVDNKNNNKETFTPSRHQLLTRQASSSRLLFSKSISQRKLFTSAKSTSRPVQRLQRQISMPRMKVAKAC